MVCVRVREMHGGRAGTELFDKIVVILRRSMTRHGACLGPGDQSLLTAVKPCCSGATELSVCSTALLPCAVVTIYHSLTYGLFSGKQCTHKGISSGPVIPSV